MDGDTKMRKIKSCPFCGKVGHINTDSHWSDATKDSLTIYGVGCNTYRCRGEFSGAIGYLDRNEAIDAWNKRDSWVYKYIRRLKQCASTV